MTNKKILGAVWFNQIGIVLINNGFENKAYIGTGSGIFEEDDIEYISNHGMPFPVKQAEEIILK